MSDTQKIRILVGLIFIMAGMGCGVALFYFMKAPPLLSCDSKTRGPAEPSVFPAENQKTQTTPSEGPLKPIREPMTLSTLVQKAEVLYDEKEKSRTEGLLWIDRKNSSFIVTLGVLHGLQPGSTLAIYDGNQKIDMAQVDVPWDVISYVKPLNKQFPYQFQRDYYRAVLEDVR